MMTIPVNFNLYGNACGSMAVLMCILTVCTWQTGQQQEIQAHKAAKPFHLAKVGKIGVGYPSTAFRDQGGGESYKSFNFIFSPMQSYLL